MARVLIEKRHVRQGLFWAHLTIEKMLKAHVCKQTRELAPRLHNLVRLAELAGLELEAGALDFLSDMNDYNIEGRYTEHLGAAPDMRVAKAVMCRVEELMTWLNEKL